MDVLANGTGSLHALVNGSESRVRDGGVAGKVNSAASCSAGGHGLVIWTLSGIGILIVVDVRCHRELGTVGQVKCLLCIFTWHQKTHHMRAWARLVPPCSNQL